MLVEKRRQVRPTPKARSGVQVGFRVATLLLLQIPEVRAALRLPRNEALSPDPVAVADHLGLEPSYARRILRGLRNAGLASVEEIPQPGTPPIRAYTIELDAASARVAAK